MAKGEARFTSSGVSVQRFENKPIPEDDYQLMLQGGDDKLLVKKSEDKGPDAIPYIGARFEVLKTAAKEGQKNRLVFHNFFLSLKPGSDGVVMPARGGGLIEFYRAHGEELDADVHTMELSNGETVDYLDPEQVMAKLEGWVDQETSAHVGIEKQKDASGKRDPKDPGRNKISFFKLPDTPVAPKGPAKPVAGLKPKVKK